MGKKGKIIIDLTNSELTLFNSLGEILHSEKILDFKRNKMFLDELKHFFHCYKKKCNTNIPISEGINGLKIVASVYDSLKNNNLVYL